jgi:hypothetical protein
VRQFSVVSQTYTLPEHFRLCITGSHRSGALKTTENAENADKTLAFVEGASHMFTTAREYEKFSG